MNHDRAAFWLAAFQALSQVWRWTEPTPERIRVYDAALSKYPVEELRLGVARVIERSTDKECPTPGKIREAIVECRLGAKPPAGLLAESARLELTQGARNA